MKREFFTKKMLLGLLLLLFTMVPVRFVSADGAELPDAVKTLGAKDIGETTATLYWSSVKGADGYVIYMVNRSTDTKRAIAKVAAPATEYKLSNLEPEVSRCYQVYAYRTQGDVNYKSAEGSPLKSIRPELNKSAKPANFRRICYGNKSVFLAWDKVEGASCYYLYQCDTSESKKKYERVAKTTATTCQVKDLEVGETYKFIVRAYRSVKGHGVLSDSSDVVKATGKKVNLAAVHGRYWSARLKETVRVKDLETGDKVTLKAGSEVWTSAARLDTITARTPDGTKFQIKGTKLKYSDLTVTKSYKYYSENQREAFVNSRGYESPTDYLIWISQYSSCLTIFKGAKYRWEQVLATDCVIGTLGHTTQGVFHLLKYDTAYGKPCIYFTWNSVKEWGQSIHCRTDGNVRGPHSSGCIRLGDKELYYLYRNCKLGTTVVSY